MGLGQFAVLKGGLDKNDGDGVFERGLGRGGSGVDTSMHTMCSVSYTIV